ncbi:response regulator [Desulfovulcanus sp.]
MACKILVVDDATTVRKFHRQQIEKIGFEADEAVNGMEALEKMLQDKFDLALVDVNMPKMDGYQFIKEMRMTPEIQHIPAIMITTEADQEDELQAYRSGANYYMVKPAKPEVLQNILKIMTGAINNVE